MQFAKEKEVKDTRIPRDEDELEEATDPVTDEASKEPEEEEEEEEEDTEDETAENEPENVEASTEEKPAAHHIFPILIRCAEARQDAAAVSAYKEEYEVAKERQVEDEARTVIKRIEDDLRSSSATLFSTEGLPIGEISPAVVTKLADLFDVEPDDESVTVVIDASDDTTASTLTITLDGTARIQPA